MATKQPRNVILSEYYPSSNVQANAIHILHCVQEKGKYKACNDAMLDKINVQFAPKTPYTSIKFCICGLGVETDKKDVISKFQRSLQEKISQGKFKNNKQLELVVFDRMLRKSGAIIPHDELQNLIDVITSTFSKVSTIISRRSSFRKKDTKKDDPPSRPPSRPPSATPSRRNSESGVVGTSTKSIGILDGRPWNKGVGRGLATIPSSPSLDTINSIYISLEAINSTIHHAPTKRKVERALDMRVHDAKTYDQLTKAYIAIAKDLLCTALYAKMTNKTRKKLLQPLQWLNLESVASVMDCVHKQTHIRRLIQKDVQNLKSSKSVGKRIKKPNPKKRQDV